MSCRLVLLTCLACGTVLAGTALKFSSCSSLALVDGRVIYQDSRTIACLDLRR